MHDYSKICRICMSSGSRDIFHRSNIDPNSPLERLLEKMRYVTMMKIEENDDLPRLICDLCIVQLNVAYNFKRQAVENDTKLRQYFIEHGITSHQSPGSGDTSNNSNIINPNSSKNNNSNNLNSNLNINIAASNAETASVRSNFTPSNNAAMSPIIRRVTNNFPIMPIIVKIEPDNDILADDLSDSVLDNNIVNQDDPLRASSISTRNRNHVNNSSSSMVYLNGYTINTLTPSSEVESYHNINTNNQITSNNLIQLSSGSSSSHNSSQNIIGSKSDNAQNTNTNKTNNISKEITKSLSPAELARKRIAQKRLGGQLKTRRIMPEKRNKNNLQTTLSTLRIDMAPPSGKISREELKKKLYFGVERKQRDSLEKSKLISNGINRNKNDKSSTIVLNPFNSRKPNSIPTSTPINKRNSTARKPISLEKAKSIRSNQMKDINKSINRSTKKSSTDIQKSQIKLIKPKIEPSSKN